MFTEEQRIEILKKAIIKLKLNQKHIIPFDRMEIYQLKLSLLDIIEKKAEESHHKADGKNEVNRWKNGFLGEMAVEKFLGINFVDLSYGDSNNYNCPDLESAGYKIGVKTASYPKFHLVNKNIEYPQILTQIHTKNGKLYILILGIASEDVLKRNNKLSESQLDSSNPNLARRKRRFILYDELIPVNSLTDLASYKLNK